MDATVLQAMAKWPNVPDCYGWLALDGRGDWYLRDDAAQKSGMFSSGKPGAKGSRLMHNGLIEFIQRNYAQTPSGAWYFQNGPQRVFVELEAAPWIIRVGTDLQVARHDGIAATVLASYVDEYGNLYVEIDVGIGRVHTQDMLWASDAVERGLWVPQSIERKLLLKRFAVVLSPEANRTQASQL